MKSPAIGAKPWMTGVSSVVHELEAWEKKLNDTLGKAIGESVDMASKSLRFAASQDKAWVPYVQHLSVEYKDGEILFNITGTPEEIKAIETLEYGDGATPPHPLLRPQLQRQKDMIKHHIEIVLAKASPYG